MRDILPGTPLLVVLLLTIAGLLWQRSKRKNAEAKLASSNERLRLAMEAGGSIGWDWDIATGRDFLFGDIRSFLGIASDTHVTSVQEFFEYIHPEDRTRVAQAVAHARQSRSVYYSEFRISVQDRPTRWIASRGEFKYAPDGTAARMFGIAVDVTEKKRMEEALKKSEEKFSTAFRQSPMALTIASVAGGRFIEVNDTYQEITGWMRDEIVGRSAIDLGIWVDIGQRAEIVRQLSTRGSVRAFEFDFHHKTGDVKTGTMSAELIEVEGEPCILAVVADITERKRADAALRESEERFRLVANCSPVAIWMSDVNHTLIYANPSWREITGQRFETNLEKVWKESIHPEDLEQYLEKIKQASDGQQSFRVEYRVRRCNGEYLWILDSGSPRFNGDASFAGYIGSAVDITEVKQAELVRATMNQRLIAAHEEERALVAGELHDDIVQRLVLLVLILTGFERALTAPLPALREKVEEARRQVEDLCKDVQALSRSLHPSIPRRLGLAKAAASLCAELSRQNVEVAFESESVPRDLPEEVSLCLYRVMQESLKNAIKHSGSRHLRVLITGQSNEIHLAVRDSGIGFNLAEATKGRGIGLNSMRERLKLVNGSLYIDSQPFHGTTVHARVPLNPQTKSQAVVH